MSLLFSNNATGTLAVTLTSGSTSAVLNSGEGQNFPTPTGGDTFYATLEDTSGNIEIVSCTARATDTLTIVRAQEGTSAIEFAAGSRLELRATAATLAAFDQTADSSDVYAPKTHFNDNGTAAEQLNNGVRATVTTAQGQAVQRTTGQTETTLSLRDGSGTEEGTVSTNTSDQMDFYNKQTSGHIRGRATDAGGTPVIVWDGDPDGKFTGYNSGDIKHQAETYGFSIRATNSLAPYDGHYRIYTADGLTLLGAIGYISSTNEFRIISYANGFPIGLFANNNGGTLASVVTGDPDGASQMFYANAKKIETTNTGGTVTGVLSQTGTPTAASHLTTKTYVDTQVATAAPSASSLAATGYRTEADGFTLQWGSTSSSSSNINVTFPQAFTTVFQVHVTERISAAGNLEHRHAVTNLTTSGFTIDKETDYSMGYYWEAKGVI